MMFKTLAHDFYVQPMNQVYFEAVSMFIIWTALMFLLRGKARRIVAGAGFVLAFALIIVFTVFGRKAGEKGELRLIPFITFQMGKRNPEFYRALFMNFLLFMPFGLSLPFALPQKAKLKPLVTIVSGFALSVFVEAVQYFAKIGECETDDVLMNTLGVAAGVMSFVIVGAVSKRFNGNSYKP